MSPAPFSPRTVRCPTCGSDCIYAASNPYRPFCSPRCKNNDFGAWGSENYRVAPTPSNDDVDALDAAAQALLDETAAGTPRPRH